jgi:methionine synthase II (cobalamin-independent)
MHKSEQRLLTTHAGSLPRPAELTRLYARQSRGEVVPAAELEVEGKAALRRVVAEQIEAGIDVANNGEQQRDSFVLYVRDRLSGLGGTWQRRQRADVERYPTFKQKSFDAIAGKDDAGVIDTTTNFVEHTEVVADRLERLAAVVGDPRRIMAGTDCGFETIAGR